MKISYKTIAIACALWTAHKASAVTYSGNISVGSGLTVGGAWASATSGGLSWVVDDTSSPGMWTYKYTFDLADQRDISHAIVEVTDGATMGEFAVSVADDKWDLGTHGPGDAENPGIPGSIFGLKVDSPDNSVEPWSWTIVTARPPVWQDFYAKAGSSDPTHQTSSWAYNTGFLAADPTEGPSNGSVRDHILGPNGVPDGGSAGVMLGMALAGLAVARKTLAGNKS